MDTNRFIDITYKGTQLTIIKSYHAIQRMRERNISDEVISSSIIYVSQHLENMINDELMVVDKINHVALMFGIERHRKYNNGYFITLITVIDKDNIFIKSNTTVATITTKEA